MLNGRPGLWHDAPYRVTITPAHLVVYHTLGGTAEIRLRIDVHVWCTETLGYVPPVAPPFPAIDPETFSARDASVHLRSAEDAIVFALRWS